MKKPKVCVYTCITGDYDNLKEVQCENNIDYLCFTDNQKIKSESWTVINIENDEKDNVTLARKYKILMNDYIKDNYDVCIWIDGAITIRDSILEFLFSKCDLQNFDMIVFEHTVRNCVYKEAATVVKYRKESINKVKNIIEFLKQENYPEDFGLTETGILIRRTQSKAVNNTMDLWFRLLTKYSVRDQLTFDYAIFKTNLKIKRLKMNVCDNQWFGWMQHQSKYSFDWCRFFFGDYVDVGMDNVVDAINQSDKDVLYSTTIKTECNYVEIVCGQLEDTLISGVEISTNLFTTNLFTTNCLLEINGSYLLSDSPLIIKANGQFKEGEELNIKFRMQCLSKKDYKDLLLLQSQLFSQYKDGLNIKMSELKEKNLKINTENEKIKSSSSWMITQPLREMGNIVRKRNADKK